uniref:Uncharacterized protein TCIL3000_10_13010 n=1 Tax=Trypanosoma congolense (strain IL3000) TaxID=1068625 RepID=G0UYQ2_TRYCI|nr:unnamed protein product [Trypanosoma congolense IL3000]
MTDWKAAANIFGRGTAAGDAIYRCYARPVKESTLDPELLERLQALRRQREEEEARIIRPKPIPKSKAPVSRPRPCAGPRISTEERARRRLAAIPRKKPATAIDKEINNFTPLPPKVFDRPPLNDDEKERLNQIFQFGEVPDKPKEFTGAMRLRYASLNKRFGLKERFDALAKRIEVLRRELHQMQDSFKLAPAESEQRDLKGPALALGPGPLKRSELRLREQQLQNDMENCLTEMKALDEEIRRINRKEALELGIDFDGCKLRNTSGVTFEA